MSFKGLEILSAAALLLFTLSASADSQLELEVGLAAGEITPEIGVPLAGYGSKGRRDADWLQRHRYATLFKPSTGVMDALRAKVMILKRDERYLVFVNTDLIAADKYFRQRLLEKLKDLPFRRDDLFLSATHTHSGPGAISTNPFWQIVAVDRFKRKVFEKLVERTAEVVRQAMAQVQPATLWHVSFEVADVQRNRRRQPGNFDPQAHFLLVKNRNDEWLGGMINFALHPISLEEDNLLYSGDNAAAIERHIQNLLLQMNRGHSQPVMMMINGAEGDVRPDFFGPEGIALIAEKFTARAVEALPRLFPVTPEFTVAKSTIKLGLAKIHLPHCLEDRKQLQRWLKLNIPLSTVFPSETEVSAVRLGELALLSWPGEPITEIGRELKSIGQQLGADATWVMALTNEHLSYFVTEGEWARGGYEACANFYGPHGSQKIIHSQRGNLQKLFR